MNLLFTLVCLVGAASFALGELKPATDARELFSTNFYRILVYTKNAGQENFVVSPAAVQKLFTAVYNAAEDKLADDILWDLYLKHIDIKRLHEEAKLSGDIDPLFDTSLRDVQLKELNKPISREDILNYFKNDFTEVSKEISFENYFVAPKDFKYSEEFTKFAQEYFPIKFLNKNPGVVSEAETKFGFTFNNDNELEILNTNFIDAQWKKPFCEDNGELSTEETFKFGDLSAIGLPNFKAIEFPLEAEVPLSLQIILPSTTRDLYIFLSQVVGRSLEDFNAISQSLKEELVLVKLPKFKIETTTNLADYFNVSAYRGLHDLFTNNVQLTRLFENFPDSGIKAASFWQKSIVNVNAHGIRPQSGALPALPPSKTTAVHIFDALEKSFFFVIKSDKTIYFAGHYIQ